MKVTWAILDFSEEPGAYPFLDGELIIEPKHIENWQANPTAVYEVDIGGSFGGIKKYTLGSWEHGV